MRVAKRPPWNIRLTDDKRCRNELAGIKSRINYLLTGP